MRSFIRLSLPAAIGVLLFACVSALAQAPSDNVARAVTLWMQSVEGSAGSGGINLSWRPIIVDGDDAVIAMVEYPGESAAAGKMPLPRAWLERRGPKGVLWRSEIGGLPRALIGFDAAATPPDAQGRSVVALAFQMESVAAGDSYGRLLSIDLTSGAVAWSEAIGYPRIAGRPKQDGEDRLFLAGVLGLAEGQTLIYGGSGAGPYQWWAGLRGANGKWLWDTGMPTRGYGEVRDARVTANGVELLIYAIAYTRDYRDRYQLVRLDRQGRLASRLDLGSPGDASFWLAGKSGLIVGARRAERLELSLRDDKGVARRFGPDLPEKLSLFDQIGPWLALSNDARRVWLVSTEGGQIGFPAGLAGADADGLLMLNTAGTRPVKMMVQRKCLEPAAQSRCRRYELALVRIEF